MRGLGGRQVDVKWGWRGKNCGVLAGKVDKVGKGKRKRCHTSLLEQSGMAE